MTKRLFSLVGNGALVVGSEASYFGPEATRGEYLNVRSL